MFIVYKKNIVFICELLKSLRMREFRPRVSGRITEFIKMNFEAGRHVFFLFCVLGGLTACENVQSVGDTLSDWTNTLAQSVVGVNPLGAEAIAIGRSVPVIAGNTFASGADHGVRLNFSYDFRLAGQSDGLIGGVPASSWLFVDRRLENSETYLQFHRVEGESLEQFGQGETFFLDRAEVTAQFYCIGEGAKETPQIISDYARFIAEEGQAVPREMLIRRMTERRVREGVGHRVDIVYIEDVLRAGYTCEDIGNLLLPSSDAIKLFLEAYKKRSERSFAIVG